MIKNMLRKSMEAGKLLVDPCARTCAAETACMSLPKALTIFGKQVNGFCSRKSLKVGEVVCKAVAKPKVVHIR